MTKKAQDIYKNFESRINNEFAYTKRHIADVDFDLKWHCKYIEEIYKDFLSMVGNMWLFNLLKESDYHELYDNAFVHYTKIYDELYDIRFKI